MIKLVAKANNDVVSWCDCDHALAGLPGQMDCPWCGCGWLWSCAECGKAFTFGVIVEINDTYDNFIRADRVRYGYEIDDHEIAEYANALQSMLADFDIGDQVVYLDGCFVRLGERNFEAHGLYAQHCLDRLPDAVAVDEPAALRRTLGNPTYWFDRELPARSE